MLLKASVFVCTHAREQSSFQKSMLFSITQQARSRKVNAAIWTREKAFSNLPPSSYKTQDSKNSVVNIPVLNPKYVHPLHPPLHQHT